MPVYVVEGRTGCRTVGCLWERWRWKLRVESRCVMYGSVFCGASGVVEWYSIIWRLVSRSGVVYPRCGKAGRRSIVRLESVSPRSYIDRIRVIVSRQQLLRCRRVARKIRHACSRRSTRSLRDRRNTLRLGERRKRARSSRWIRWRW